MECDLRGEAISDSASARRCCTGESGILECDLRGEATSSSASRFEERLEEDVLFFPLEDRGVVTDLDSLSCFFDISDMANGGDGGSSFVGDVDEDSSFVGDVDGDVFGDVDVFLETGDEGGEEEVVVDSEAVI